MSLPAPHTHGRAFAAAYGPSLKSKVGDLSSDEGADVHGGRRRQSFKRLLQRRERDRRGESGEEAKGSG